MTWKTGDLYRSYIRQKGKQMNDSEINQVHSQDAEPPASPQEHEQEGRKDLKEEGKEVASEAESTLETP